jgi:DNA-binding transcriptional LysR family regulator
MTRAFDPVQLGSIEMFCKAAELQGFTSAAQALGITAAAVSRSVGRLEDRLGVRLFVRTTRQMRLTEEGRTYFEQCRQALAQIEDAERAVGGRQAQPAGLLRVSLPTTYAHFRLLPMLPAFMQRHPQIRLELDVSNRNIDFVEAGYDLAIRLGPPEDSRLVARPLEDATLGVFASPHYLKRRGAPQTLEQLRQHDCIEFVLPSSGRGMPWIFRDAGQPVDFAFEGRVRVHDDVLAAVTYAAAGGGLFQIYHFIADRYVATGQLQEVMQPYGGRSRPFSILYPQNRHLSARVRAFVDFFARPALHPQPPIRKR